MRIDAADLEALVGRPPQNAAAAVELLNDGIALFIAHVQQGSAPTPREEVAQAKRIANAAAKFLQALGMHDGATTLPAAARHLLQQPLEQSKLPPHLRWIWREFDDQNPRAFPVRRAVVGVRLLKAAADEAAASAATRTKTGDAFQPAPLALLGWALEAYPLATGRKLGRSVDPITGKPVGPAWRFLISFRDMVRDRLTESHPAAAAAVPDDGATAEALKAAVANMHKKIAEDVQERAKCQRDAPPPEKE